MKAVDNRATPFTPRPMRRTCVIASLALWACAPGAPSRDADSAQATPAAQSAGASADSVAIAATLGRWYRAMQAVDSAGILAPLTPQFLLLEDTLPLSGPELVARLRQGGTDARWTAAFSDWRTRIEGNVAWTTLRNHETSRGKDGKECQADFLETIVFLRQDGRWLIDRYHAAALHRWSCEA